MKTYSYSDDPIKREVDFYQAEAFNGVSILYFHGGGLIYGSRKDIEPDTLERFLHEGYHFFSFDYRLAPESILDQIYEDGVCGVEWFLSNAKKMGLPSSEYVLFGRSAGAYLALLLSTEERILTRPLAVLAYYGYGFLTPDWYEDKSPYYRGFPEITEEIASAYIEDTEVSHGAVHRRFPIYIHARQSGRWLDMLTGDVMPDFIERFTLLDPGKTLRMPRVFLCHSLLDPDVPFSESLTLHHALPGSRLYSCAIPRHEIDTDPVERRQILKETFDFLAKTLQTH